MQNNINLKLRSNIDNTFRVQKIKNDFDIQKDYVEENINVEINIPNEWNIGLIVGNSGTGKTTIAKELFDYKEQNYIYNHKSVIDDFSKEYKLDDIISTFYSVGFSSVPNWLKPYKVLSNGEKMRVDLANSLLKNENITIFDEFTSVVDRNVGKNISRVVSNYVKKHNKKFVAVSCHYDIINELQPDWIIDMNKKKQYFTKNLENLENLKLGNAVKMNGNCLANIII